MTERREEARRDRILPLLELPRRQSVPSDGQTNQLTGPLLELVNVLRSTPTIRAIHHRCNAGEGIECGCGFEILELLHLALKSLMLPDRLLQQHLVLVVIPDSFKRADPPAEKIDFFLVQRLQSGQIMLGVSIPLFQLSEFGSHLLVLFQLFNPKTLVLLNLPLQKLDVRPYKRFIFLLHLKFQRIQLNPQCFCRLERSIPLIHQSEGPSFCVCNLALQSENLRLQQLFLA